MRSEERSPNAQRYWAVLVFVVLGTFIGIWHNNRNDRGKPDYVAGGVRGFVAPPANMLGRITHWFGAQGDWLFHGRNLAAENRSLKERIAELEGENAALHETQINYNRLRDDLGFVKGDGKPRIAADVIARRADPKFDTLLISRGSQDGVKPNSVVVSRNGLVGRVFEVTPGTASVLMLTDQKSGVGARVQREESRAVGVCEGDNSAVLMMLGLSSEADIKKDDVIVTSGLGGVYPKGLVIGTVLDVKADEGNVGKVVRVKPRVDFDHLEEVYVLP